MSNIQTRVRFFTKPFKIDLYLEKNRVYIGCTSFKLDRFIGFLAFHLGYNLENCKGIRESSFLKKEKSSGTYHSFLGKILEEHTNKDFELDSIDLFSRKELKILFKKICEYKNIELR